MPRIPEATRRIRPPFPSHKSQQIQQKKIQFIDLSRENKKEEEKLQTLERGKKRV